MKTKPKNKPTQPQLVRNAIMRSTLALLSRGVGLDQGERNLDKECGYIEGDPSVQDYRQMFDQEGVATRIVDLYPNECWGIYPEVYEEEGTTVTAFERAWDRLADRIDPWYYFQRGDELSNIGHYGIVLLGISDGRPLNVIVDGLNERGQEVPRVRRDPVDLLYMRPFSEDLVTITEFETDPTNPRYGLPRMYTVKMTDPSLNSTIVYEPRFSEVEIHWSRVIHLADNCKSCEWAGVPRLKNTHRRVYDIRKILSSSGEMFYKGGFPGLSFETDPDLVESAEIDMDSLKKEINLYSQGMQRYMRLVGMTAKSLAPQVADPTNHLIQQYQYICSTIKAPLKIFMGTDAASATSSEDRQMWNGRLASRQKLYLNPRVIKPFVNRLISTGVLPSTKKGTFVIKWKDLNALSDSDKADRALKLAQSVLQYVTSGSHALVSPKMFFTQILQFTDKEADALIEAVGGSDKIIKTLDKMKSEEAGNTPNTTNTSPTKNTGASGRTNGLGRSAKNKTRSRNSGN